VPAESVQVEVVYCPRPGVAEVVSLRLPSGATAADALRQCGLLERHGLTLDGLVFGVWCRLCEPGMLLRDRDRVEIYRPLTVDPKEARRQRYKRQRAKA
jgi:putative ubiquitin-RnfH superfamily antitoxin RatB of RatAB toxin-antitoxin module